MTGPYLVCVSIWIGYLLAREPKPASVAVLPHDEVEHGTRNFNACSALIATGLSYAVAFLALGIVVYVAIRSRHAPD